MYSIVFVVKFDAIVVNTETEHNVAFVLPEAWCVWYGFTAT